ncbi:sugar phosphate nucleotidyltransferase [Natrialba swarupiae]|uniref:NDP-sugar synthase n=1 Tax=Natrialba swarupiae TaxID=2448032 RepID=A0A5D5AH00_9EURY|nr:NDP-sugar synthase [Natrialba swarupiae]TYT60986.1 NDP-sugar synthase [Natrialba swarupiae]
MDAVVLAGGYATRMWPITKRRPKMFLPIDDTTVVDRIFEELEADDRVENVYVSTNARFADEFQSHLEKQCYEKPTLSIEQTSSEREKLGVIGAIEQLIERESLSEDTVIIAGDNYISFDISEFIDHFQHCGTPTIAAYNVGSTEKASQYGVVKVESGQVVDFQEKPADPRSSLISIACYAFPADTLKRVHSYLIHGNNPDEPGWFIQWLQSRQTVHAFSFDGAWFDIGTPGSYLDAIGHQLNGDVSIDPTATVKNSDLGSNVHVMQNAKVIDATLDRAVVFPDSSVLNASVRNCVLDESCVIEGVDLDGSVIGSYSQLRNEIPN